jgi:ankyrin repeat protein
MKTPNLPDAVASAIASGDVTRFKELYQPNMTLEEIAKHAAKHGQPQIMQWCCDQGWRPPQESLNNDFIFSAVSGASPTIFQILINHGLDLNAHENEIHGDALASAVMNGHYDFAKWLLEHGHRSTPNDPLYGVDSAISWTICGDGANQEMLKLLLDHGHDLENSGAGVAAAEEGNVEALKLLLDRGLNIEDRNMSWYPFDKDEDEPYESDGTALYRACRQGNVECVELLLERGADPLAKDLEGTSCLDIARQRGYEDVVRLLEDSGLVNSAKADQSLLKFIKRLFSF